MEVPWFWKGLGRPPSDDIGLADVDFELVMAVKDSPGLSFRVFSGQGYDVGVEVFVDSVGVSKLEEVAKILVLRHGEWSLHGEAAGFRVGSQGTCHPMVLLVVV